MLNVTDDPRCVDQLDKHLAAIGITVHHLNRAGDQQKDTVRSCTSGNDPIARGDQEPQAALDAE